MSPLIYAALVAGFLLGFTPTRLYYEAKEDKRAAVEAEAALAQEKENVRIVTQLQDLLTGVDRWYRANPVRVRIQGREGSAACPTTNAADIVLTVGGVKRSDGGATGP